MLIIKRGWRRDVGAFDGFPVEQLARKGRVMSNQKGVTLVELVVALAIGAFVMGKAMLGVQDMVLNSQIRAVAEDIRDGIQMARTEAVHRNAIIRFQLTNTLTNSCVVSPTGPHWLVSLDDPAGLCANAASNTVAPRIIRKSSTSGTYTSIAVNAGQSSVTFSGLGRQIDGDVAAADFGIDVQPLGGGVCMATGGSARCLRVQVSMGGQVRVCDPAIADSTDPWACQS